jgi:isoleucyl-tRNA synthetase
MNVRSVIVTSQEDSYNVKYKIISDAKALGTKFKKDAARIKKAIENLSMDQIKQFLSSEEIQVEGFKLTSEELKVTRYFDESNKNFQANFTKEVLVLLDTELDQSLVDEGMAREIVNRVQRLRKKAGLNAIDKVEYHLKMNSDPNQQLEKVLSSQKDTLNKYLKQDIEIYSVTGSVILEEEQEVGGSKFLLALVSEQ